MHGNVLTDIERERIYYTTYEEILIEGNYYTQVKLYTYQFIEGVLTQTGILTLADDLNIAEEANPRVGAAIDSSGNIAIAFGNYKGVLFVHVYDALNDIWIKHSVIHYLDTYMGDSNLYPYVRINGINQIRVVASRDTSKDEYGNPYSSPARDYTRYFQYTGNEWTHFIIADLRDEADGDNQSNATPVELYLDNENNTHVIIKEDNTFHYYFVDASGTVTEKDILKLVPEMLVTFIRIASVNGHRYYIVSGDGVQGFKQTGYIEIYDYETHKLLYRNHAICNMPYLFVATDTDSDYLDLMIISRDQNYQENSDTHYLRIKFD